MIRALLLRLLGFRPLYEVRSVNQSTKKDLPGTRLFASKSYRKALAAYKKERAKLKDDHKLKLQAVIIHQMHWRVSHDTVQEEANQIANKRLENIKTVVSGQGAEDSPFELHEEAPEPTIVETSEAAPAQAVGGSLPPGLVDESAKGLFLDEDPAESHDNTHVVTGSHPRDLPVPEHECNYAGPMVLIEGRYTPTCSICDAVR